MEMGGRARLCNQQRQRQRQSGRAPKQAEIVLAPLKQWFKPPCERYRNQVADASQSVVC